MALRDPKLPAFEQVLTRKTSPPVCLYSYYIYLRDNNRSVENLDFWLDVVAHENLCKIYCKELLSTLSLNSSLNSPNSSKNPRFSIGRLSLRDISNELRFSTFSGVSNESSYSLSTFSIRPKSQVTQSDSKVENHTEQYCLNLPHSESDVSNPENKSNVSPSGTEKKVQREDLRKSAERIYYKYIVSGAEKELILPGAIRFQICQMLEMQQRDDPEVFLQAKEFVFQEMLANSFPRFLRTRAYSNITPFHAMFRLVLGLFLLFVGFAAEFTLIFMDVQPKALRFWGLIPIWLGVCNIHVHQERLSPGFTLLGLSEKTLFHFNRVRDPHIRRLHIKKALRMVLLDLVVSLIIAVIFYVVPGHRL
ncbi:regulator of G protein signaling superfamily [Basidiobolus meristosporus CBS 931.73]|uniref:Regulator of G protein signaling superfamily n=1 Tax=Basidiobolus meristosporus CBS 931.73 TaxID=1314790 RepID=A0A1Y1Y837_9FUNG|nr:regulator of G protein signaling superfamily [Basidiobolus meristosporus CBS 931.73]|eukprot:ORX93744.1 regulator of G protein signaling superfamily [Basidiobolus meristosporus CBS 931.73]